MLEYGVIPTVREECVPRRVLMHHSWRRVPAHPPRKQPGKPQGNEVYTFSMAQLCHGCISWKEILSQICKGLWYVTTVTQWQSDAHRGQQAGKVWQRRISMNMPDLETEDQISM